MGSLAKILTPVNYIRIKHSEKRIFDFWIPLFFSILIGVGLFFLEKPINLINKDGLISVINGILQILSGFYIASMAAVATFQKDGMDRIMAGSPPILKGQELTRRKFLTYLFGYLAFSSIVLYFIGGGTQLLAPTLTSIDWLKIKTIKYLLVTFYMFFIMNILSTTILGMHFMIDRMHDDAKTLKIEHKDFEK